MGGLLDMIDRARVEVWQRRHKRRTGHRIDTTIHPDDEMAAYIRGLDPSPIAHYLDSGASMATALDQALAAAGRTLDPHAAFLEFACGHGRFTRHLVHRIDPRRLTVADIDADAVAWVTDRYGVDGFVSTSDPADLDHDGRYALIFVASLFSHLPRRRWVPWADRLLGMLEPGGLLVLSTNGPPTDLPEVEPGYWYGPDNETGGRLGPDEYGTTVVAEAWVRAAIDGEVLAVLPAALWGVQDIYAITR